MKNGTFKIDKGIPVPEKKRRTDWGRLIDTFTQMKPGDSVEVEISYNSAYQAASRYFGRGKFRLSATDKGVLSQDSKHIRIWRLA